MMRSSKNSSESNKNRGNADAVANNTRSKTTQFGTDGSGSGTQNVNSRYHHDIQHAMILQAEGARRKQQQREASSRTIDTTSTASTAACNNDDGVARRPQQLDSSNVTRLGLEGLEEAEKLHRIGDLSSALKLYELSLDVLIRFLRSDTDATTVDRDTVNARVRGAFTYAESVKATLKQQEHQHQPSSQQEPQHIKRFQMLSNALTSVISNHSKQTQLMVAENKAPSNAKTATYVFSSADGNNAQRRATTTNVQNYRTSASLSPTSSAQRERPRQLQKPLQQNHPAEIGDPATKELRRTVLSDLYVNSTDLQKTTWDDISGLAEVKQSLQETTILPLIRPDLFTGLRKPQNLLLYGPPGTGKTMLVRAAANESNCSLFACTAGTLTSKWMGESEKLVRTLFQIARELAPSIIFIDEIDSILSKRKSDGGEHEASRRLKTEFMIQMDGIQSSDNEQEQGRRQKQHVLVLGCTNCPWDVDSAILRRFPRRLMVPLPDPDARLALLKHLLKKAGEHNITSKQMKTLVSKMDGYSGSDMTAIASDASFGPIRSMKTTSTASIKNVSVKDVRPIMMEDFERAISHATRSVTTEQIRQYADWQRRQQ